MLNNDRLSDVKFVAANSHVESESKQVILAHKFILAIGSPVFEAMFYGELAETKDTIELPDCDCESLLELFRYMYSDEVNLSGSNVMGVLYLAKKYMVPSLTDKCMEYLKEKLDPSNVFIILPFVQKYEHKTLEYRCWNVIDKQTEAAVKSEGFETIERSLLEAIVARDSLTIKEVALFKAVDGWATKQCKKQSLAAEGQMKRRILGEEVIKAIRFPLMTAEEFADVVLDSNILHLDEITSLFKFFNSALPSPVAFSNALRQSSALCSTTSFPGFYPPSHPVHRCGRFQIVNGTGWGCTGLSRDVLGFVVNQDIQLYGVCLFGSENKSYTVTLEVKDTTNNTTVVSKSEKYLSKRLPYESVSSMSYYGFEVFFDSAASLRKKTCYHIEALICGPPSGAGRIGNKSVTTYGITFTFRAVVSPGISNNRTDVNVGQFPQFLFSCK